jgi:hypothetical protein
MLSEECRHPRVRREVRGVGHQRGVELQHTAEGRRVPPEQVNQALARLLRVAFLHDDRRGFGRLADALTCGSRGCPLSRAGAPRRCQHRGNCDSRHEPGTRESVGH